MTDFKTLQEARRKNILKLIAAAQTAAASPFDLMLRRTLRDRLEHVTAEDVLRVCKTGKVATDFLKNIKSLIHSQNSHQAAKAGKALKQSSLAYRLTPRPDTTHKRPARQRADIHA